MTLKINKLIYLLLAVFLIVGISGCTDSNPGSKSGVLGSNSISKSSVTSKLAASQNSGIFQEKAIAVSYGSCKQTVSQYHAVYNNGDTLDIYWNKVQNPPCDNKIYIINYVIKNSNSNDEFKDSDAYHYQTISEIIGGNQEYGGPSGRIQWTTDGRVDPSQSTGDINEANEFINLGKNKANEILNRYNSGQLKSI